MNKVRTAARRLRIGDTIPIRITPSKLPLLAGLVTAITPDAIHYIYTPDSPVFAGLRGFIRLPGKGGE
jgi:hypothetical protein